MTPKDKEILKAYNDAIGLASGFIYGILIGFSLFFLVLAISNC